MSKIDRRSLWWVVGLFLATVLVLGIGAGRSRGRRAAPAQNNTAVAVGGPLTLRARLVQDKVLRGMAGSVTLALTLTAADDRLLPPQRGVDLVVVLDRSGSMAGAKIDAAREAVVRLLAALTPADRLALLTYSNGVAGDPALRPVTEDNRHSLAESVARIAAGGGTNLGQGLQAGIDVLRAAPADGNLRRIIVISDGLANQGITDSARLAQMAASAVSQEFVLSTVGVGNDFNEDLLSRLADHGTGNYYYLESPAAFAAVFEEEYLQARAVAVDELTVRLPLPAGVTLTDAGGYPFRIAQGQAEFHPGSLRAGQTRTVYLTLQVPTTAAGSIRLEGLQADFRHGSQSLTARLPQALAIACVDDAAAVAASLDKGAWTDKVLQEDFGRLKEEVAAAIRRGDAPGAIQSIQTYREEQAAVNRVVASPEVARNLEQEMPALVRQVEETFSGAAAEVAAKQKQSAKSLQYDGYQNRRDKK
jgi:Ca-activated chloride channel family protein